ncbi:MAG: GNAT family N-acetyltransferase [Ilumatobacteraceae bacterium]
MPPAIRPATSVDIDPIATALANAFHDDPVKLHLLGGKSVPQEKVKPFFTTFQKIQIPHGHVYTTAGYEAAAIWAPPDHWRIPFTTVLKHSPTFLKLYGLRLFNNLGVLAAMEKAHGEIEYPHYYLEIIGTDPAHQGKGFGAALVQPMVDRADEEGVGMYLESSKESNIAFYGRFGFTVRRKLHLKNGPQMWLMERAPR